MEFHLPQMRGFGFCRGTCVHDLQSTCNTYVDGPLFHHCIRFITLQRGGGCQGTWMTIEDQVEELQQGTADGISTDPVMLKNKKQKTKKEHWIFFFANKMFFLPFAWTPQCTAARHRAVTHGWEPTEFKSHCFFFAVREKHSAWSTWQMFDPNGRCAQEKLAPGAVVY